MRQARKICGDVTVHVLVQAALNDVAGTRTVRGCNGFEQRDRGLDNSGTSTKIIKYEQNDFHTDSDCNNTTGLKKVQNRQGGVHPGGPVKVFLY